jgi:hypothetical protein
MIRLVQQLISIEFSGIFDVSALKFAVPHYGKKHALGFFRKNLSKISFL